MKNLSQYMFDMERFGVSPSKLAYRLSGKAKGVPRILTVTMPKSGTNLLQRILVLHPALSRAWLPTLGQRNREKWSNPQQLFASVGEGKIVSTHFDFEDDLARLLRKQLGFKLILMVRDPRDAVISDMHYIQTWPGHPLKAKITAMPDDKTRLIALIEGRDGIRNIRDQILRFSEWSRYAHTVRFEDAVGAAGGGSDEEQFNVIKTLFAYLDMPLCDREVRFVANNARSSKTQTFRTGKIRNWEHVYDREVKDAFREVAGNLLIDLGYEDNTDW